MLRPTFTLTIAGLTSTLDEPLAGPRALCVERDLDVPADGLTVFLRERAGVALGDEVTAALGHDGDEETVFTGRVAEIRPDLAGVGIRALGRMQELLRLHTAGTFAERTAGSIASDLIGQAGLESGTIDDGPQLPRYAIDRRRSAFVHLKQLADRLGFELFTDRDGKVMFRALGPAAGLGAGGLGGALAAGLAAVGLGGAGVGYAFGRDLLAAVGARGEDSWGSVRVGGESPMSRQGETAVHWLASREVDASGGGGGAPELLVLDPAARTQDLAQRFAAGHQARFDRRRDEVRCTVLGRPQVELGEEAELTETPDELLGGSGYVRGLRHRLDPETGFVTDLRVALGGTP